MLQGRFRATVAICNWSGPKSGVLERISKGWETTNGDKPIPSAIRNIMNSHIGDYTTINDEALAGKGRRSETQKLKS